MATDRAFLERMFVEAVRWAPGTPRQPLAALLGVPELRRYFVDWGRPGDVALIAAAGPTPAGAAWWRCFRADAPGYGFVDESIPEIGIAVEPAWRGRGIGTDLLAALIERARAGRYPGLSLSVGAANPARRLYERCGFVKVGEAGSSWTMLARFGD